MSNLRAHIYGELAVVQHIQILGECLPPPSDAFREGCAGDVFHAFHETDEPVFLAGPHRGEADPAVAHHDSSHAVLRRRLKKIVPSHLPVIMSMDIHEARCHDHAPCVHNLPSRRRAIHAGIRPSSSLRQGCARFAASDIHDLPALHSNIADKAVSPRPVHHRPVGNQQVIHGCAPSFGWDVLFWLAYALCAYAIRAYDRHCLFSPPAVPQGQLLADCG